MPSEDAVHSEWETVTADNSSTSSYSQLTRDHTSLMRFSSEGTYVQENVNHIICQDGEEEQLRTTAAEENSLLGRIDQLQEVVSELCDKIAALTKVIHSQQETISKLVSSQNRSIAVFFTENTHEINGKSTEDANAYYRSVAVQTASTPRINTDVIPEVVGTPEWEACWYGTTIGILPSKKQNWQCKRGRQSNCRSGRIHNDRLSASVTSTLDNDLSPPSKAQLEEWGCCSSEDDGAISSASSAIYQAKQATNTSIPSTGSEHLQISAASIRDGECDGECRKEP